MYPHFWTHYIYTISLGGNLVASLTINALIYKVDGDLSERSSESRGTGYCISGKAGYNTFKQIMIKKIRSR